MKRMILLACLTATLACFAACTGRRGPGAAVVGRDSLAAARIDSPAATKPWLVYTYSERRGKRVYDRFCAVCHGEAGGGDGFNSYNLDPKPRDLGDSIYVHELASSGTLLRVITLGGRGINKSNEMPAYQYTLTRQDISDVAAYILTFSRHTAPSR